MIGGTAKKSGDTDTSSDLDKRGQTSHGQLPPKINKSYNRGSTTPTASDLLVSTLNGNGNKCWETKRRAKDDWTQESGKQMTGLSMELGKTKGNHIRDEQSEGGGEQKRSAES